VHSKLSGRARRSRDGRMYTLAKCTPPPKNYQQGFERYCEALFYFFFFLGGSPGNVDRK
jgi:hypothetical protein